MKTLFNSLHHRTSTILGYPKRTPFSVFLGTFFWIFFYYVPASNFLLRHFFYIIPWLWVSFWSKNFVFGVFPKFQISILYFLEAWTKFVDISKKYKKKMKKKMSTKFFLINFNIRPQNLQKPFFRAFLRFLIKKIFLKIFFWASWFCSISKNLTLTFWKCFLLHHICLSKDDGKYGFILVRIKSLDPELSRIMLKIL